MTPAIARRTTRQRCLAYILAARRRKWWIVPLHLTPDAVRARMIASLHPAP